MRFIVIGDAGGGLVNQANVILLVYPRTVLGPPLFSLFLTEPLPTAFEILMLKCLLKSGKRKQV